MTSQCKKEHILTEWHLNTAMGLIVVMILFHASLPMCAAATQPEHTKSGTMEPSIETPNKNNNSVHGKRYVCPSDSIRNHADKATPCSLAWTIRQIGSDWADVELPGNHQYSLEDDLTIPENIRLIKQPGAIFTAPHPVTLRFKCLPDLGTDQAFGDNVNVVFSEGLGPIVSDWFGNDLSRTYASATSQSLITYYGNQVVSSTIHMSKIDVSIDGVNAKAHVITPTTTLKGPMFVLGNPTTRPGNIFMKNMNIDGRIGEKGASHADYGIKVVSAYFSVIEDVVVAYTKSHGIYVDANGKGSPNIILTVRNTSVGNVGGVGFRYYNTSNMNVSQGLSLDHVWVRGSADSGYNFESRNGWSVGVHMNDVNYEHGAKAYIGRHGFEFNGQIHFDWDGGYAEVEPDNATHKSILVPYSVPGSDGTIKRVQTSNLPYVASSAVLDVCHCDFAYQPELRGSCYTLGNPTSVVEPHVKYPKWGPPNQPVNGELWTHGYNSGARFRDSMGTWWACHKGGNGSSSQWRAETIPIIRPLSHVEFDDDNSVIVWYPQLDFIVTRVSVSISNDWDNATANHWISLGTHDNHVAWTAAFYPPRMDPLTPVTSSANVSGYLYQGAERVMPSMAGATPYPDCRTGKTNCIIAKTSSRSAWTAGSLNIAIYGRYVNYIHLGSEP